MRKNVNRAVSAAILTGGMFIASAGFAHAGTEVRVGDVLSVPIKVCGNAVGLTGDAKSTCEPDDKPAPRAETQPLVSVPVTVCGNAVGVLGNGDASCGDAPASQPSGSVISAPVTVCGNGIGVLSGGNGDCGGGSQGPGPQPEPPGQNPNPNPNPNPPNNGDGNRPPGSGLDDISDHLGLERPSHIGAAAAEVKPLPKTGVDVAQFLAAGLALLVGGAAAHRLGARRRVTD